MTNLMNSLKTYYFLCFILLFIIFIGFFVFIEIISYNPNYNSIIFMAKDSTSPGVVEANNISINGVEVGLTQIRDGAIYIGGMTAAAKLVKGSTLPLGAKLGATVLMGATSLVGYKMIEANTPATRTHGNIGISVDNVSAKVSTSNTNPFIKKLTESGDNEGSQDLFNISSLDVGQLQLDFYLQVLIINLLVILFIFLIMKSISDREIKFKFLDKSPFIQRLLIKLFKL